MHCINHSIPSTRLILSFALSISSITISQLSAFAAQEQNTDLSQISKLYTTAHYAEGLTLVEKMLGQNSKSPELHYLKANLLKAIGNEEQARKEYVQTISLKPNAQVMNYCLQALKDFAPVVKAKIDQQVNIHSNIIQLEASNRGNALNSDAKSFAQSIMEEAMRTAKIMRRSGYTFDGQWVPIYSEAEIQAVINNAEARVDVASSAAQQSQQDLQTAAAIKATATAKSAENLQSLIDAPAVLGQPKLTALGTNLFVRNYSTEYKPEIGQLAKQDKLPESLPANPGSLDLKKVTDSYQTRGSLTTRTSVAGKVISSRVPTD